MLKNQFRQLNKVKNIPGPLALPFIGTLYQLLGADLSQCFRKIILNTKRYGKVIRLVFGNQLIIVISDPDTIERTIGNKTLIDRAEIAKINIKTVFGDGILLNSGETWKTHRKLLSGLFHNNSTENFLVSFSKYSAVLADNLAKVSKETIFDTYSYVLPCTIDIIIETLMGAKSNLQTSVNTDLPKQYNKVLHYIAHRAKRPWLYVDFIFKRTKMGKTLENILIYLYDFTQGIINERKVEYNKIISKEENNQTKYLFDVLFESGEVTDKEILVEGFNIMTTGSETTATVFSFVLVALGEYQEIQDKVMEEQWRIFNSNIDQPVTYEDLQNMVYLEQVVKEVLRLYPPVSFLFRKVVDEDIDLGGGMIAPKGSDICAICTNIHKDPALFPDPERFDPDRFSSENSYGRHPYAFLPFGAGRRQCIGSRYAMMELKTMLSVVLRRIKVVRAIDGLKEIENNLEFANNFIITGDNSNTNIILKIRHIF
ncbi:hypothetical protein L9F63_009716, partial [Diploptera punctata]